MFQSLAYLCDGLPLNPLPENKGRNKKLPHAPKRLHQLDLNQQQQAVNNALRYFPKSLHPLLKNEFEQELQNYGHIYMYRFKAKIPSSQDLCWNAFKAKNIHCATIMVQLCNNLCEEIAQYPEELVTYGGNGQCLANWAQFWIIMNMLSKLNIGETLILNSSHPQGVYPNEIVSMNKIPKNSLEHWNQLIDGFKQNNIQPVHSPSRPLLQISNGLCVPNYSTAAHYQDFFALGVSNYGQMTAGSFCYIGPQGIVHGTTITLMSAAAQYYKKFGFTAHAISSEMKERQTEQYALKVKQVTFPFVHKHMIQLDRKQTDQRPEKQPLVYLSSGLGGMSGAQAKAGLIAGIISVIAEIRPEPIVKRFNQKWVDEIITDLDLLIKRIRQLKHDKKVSSIAFYGNIVDVWEKIVDLHSNGEILINLASDQTSCHDIKNGGYIPVSVNLNELNNWIANEPELFEQYVRDSLKRQVKAINYITQNSPVIFWDYGNAFLLESLKAGANLIQNQNENLMENKCINQLSIVKMKLRYQSYIESIMGDIFSLGFGPFRWICSSNKIEDLRITDQIATDIMQSELTCCGREIQNAIGLNGQQIELLKNRYQQLENNLNWIKQADHHELVVGCKSRILYADRRARERIALAFNQAIREGKLHGPIVLSRDHHDVSSVDSPFRETSNITDGSKFTADMAIQNAIGLSARGVTWVAIHNGGGVGFGESINGGFGFVLDGTEINDNSIKLIMNWDVNNGVSRRAWAGNENALGTIEQEVHFGKLQFTYPNY